MPFIKFRNFPFCSWFIEHFSHERVLDSVECFFCVCWNGFVVFVFYSINMPYYISWFGDVKPTLHSWNKSHLVMVYNLFLHVAGFNLLVFFFEDFSIYIHERYWPIIFFFLSYLCLVGVLLSQPKLEIRSDCKQCVSGQKKKFFFNHCIIIRVLISGLLSLAKHNLETQRKSTLF